MKYQVGITIHNSFEVEADSEAEAEYLVREFTSRKILEDSDFKVTYNDKITEEDGNGHEAALWNGLAPTKR